MKAEKPTNRKPYATASIIPFPTTITAPVINPKGRAPCNDTVRRIRIGIIKRNNRLLSEAHEQAINRAAGDYSFNMLSPEFAPKPGPCQSRHLPSAHALKEGWPFTLFSPAEYSQLDEKLRRQTEDRLCGAIARQRMDKPDSVKPPTSVNT